MEMALGDEHTFAISACVSSSHPMTQIITPAISAGVPNAGTWLSVTDGELSTVTGSDTTQTYG